jgi:hypothetical protein
MLFGKKTSRVLSLSFSLSLSPVNLGYQMRQKKEFFWSLSVSLSPVNLGYQMRQEKKEFFGLSPLCTQKENVTVRFLRVVVASDQT